MHAARIYAGLNEPLAVTLFKKENDKRKDQEIAWYAAQPKGTKILTTEAAASSNAPPPQVPLHRRVNVRDIADDLRNQEIELMDKGDIAVLLRNWRKKIIQRGILLMTTSPLPRNFLIWECGRKLAKHRLSILVFGAHTVTAC